MKIRALAAGLMSAPGRCFQHHHRGVSGSLALTVAALLAPLLGPGRASATFPGENGRIAFTGYDGQDNELFSIAPDGSDLRQLTVNTASDDYAAFSPDGSQIAFWSNRGPVGSPSSEIYVMNVDGTNQPGSPTTPKPWSTSTRFGLRTGGSVSSPTADPRGST
jgi:Tol biopolymer transport system component